MQDEEPEGVVDVETMSRSLLIGLRILLRRNPLPLVVRVLELMLFPLLLIIRFCTLLAPLLLLLLFICLMPLLSGTGPLILPDSIAFSVGLKALLPSCFDP